MNDTWTPESLERLPWFGELRKLVQAAVDRAADDGRDREPALRAEIRELTGRRQGLAQSLAKSDLDDGVRTVLEGELATVVRRLRDVQGHLDDRSAAADQARAVVDPAAIADRLNRLAELLAGENATRTNIELARHVDAIRCHADGRVTVRTCKLGALAVDSRPPIFFTAPPPAESADDAADGRLGQPRKRCVRRLEGEDDLRDVAHWAADVDRFQGLGGEWFWEDEFRIPEPSCWSKDHAQAVAALRKEGWSHDRLADHFGKTVPTIRAALRHARAGDAALAALPKKAARARWQDSHVEAVLALWREKWSVRRMSEHFGVSEPLVRAALKLGIKAGGPTAPGDAT